MFHILFQSLQPSEVKVEADVVVEEKIKKCEDDLKKEDKAELSVQSSFGSESVPDSPASQVSQRLVESTYLACYGHSIVYM